MPSLIDESIALKIDAIERHNLQRPRTRPDGSAEIDPNTGASHSEVTWLISTLRREMATNEQLRSSIDHLCARIEEVHDELIISRRRPTT